MRQRHALPRMIAAGGLVAAAAMWAEAAAADRVIRGRTSAAETSAAGAEAPDDASKMQKQLKEILAKQEEILANQATILQKFDVIMEELRIIKVRATIRGGS